MENLIFEALQGIGLDTNYICRADEATECIVYNFTESPLSYADNKKIGDKYTILVNAFVKKDVVKYKQKINKAMVEAGFIEAGGAETQKADNDFFAIALRFKKTIIY